MSMRIKRRQGNRLPRPASVKILGLGLSHPIDKDECVFIAQDMSSRAGNQCEVGMDRAVRVFDLLRLDGEMSHPGGQSLEEGFHEARPAGSGPSVVELRLLIQGHPVEKPRVGVVFDADFDVDEHAPAEERGAMSDALLCEA